MCLRIRLMVYVDENSTIVACRRATTFATHATSGDSAMHGTAFQCNALVSSLYIAVQCSAVQYGCCVRVCAVQRSAVQCNVLCTNVHNVVQCM